ncbi:MAG: M10 family metallopeptidase C-terminal domain-containing protein [Nodosilinea sp.]
MAFFTGFDASNLPITLPTNEAGEPVFDGFSLAPTNPISATPEKLVFTTVAPGSTVILEGTGFQVENGQVVQGEVTTLTVKVGDQIFLQASELTGIDAAEAFSLALGAPEDPVTPYFAYLLQGDDVFVGTKFNDLVINGYGGNDIIFGRGGDDILTGGTGSDQLYGGQGQDTLIGVNPLADHPGAGEQDILTGGKGADIFVLGDANAAYYTAHGWWDYALVTDFQVGQDKIQLAGAASDYTLTPYGFGCSYGTAIYLQGAGNGCCCGGGELIGVVQNTPPYALNLSDASQFVYAA